MTDLSPQTVHNPRENPITNHETSINSGASGSMSDFQPASEEE
jgi:hypothetical protein